MLDHYCPRRALNQHPNDNGTLLPSEPNFFWVALYIFLSTRNREDKLAWLGQIVSPKSARLSCADAPSLAAPVLP